MRGRNVLPFLRIKQNSKIARYDATLYRKMEVKRFYLIVKNKDDLNCMHEYREFRVNE